MDAREKRDKPDSDSSLHVYVLQLYSILSR